MTSKIILLKNKRKKIIFSVKTTTFNKCINLEKQAKIFKMCHVGYFYQINLHLKKINPIFQIEGVHNLMCQKKLWKKIKGTLILKIFKN